MHQDELCLQSEIFSVWLRCSILQSDRQIWFKTCIREEPDFKRRSRNRQTTLTEVDRGFPQSIVKITSNILCSVDCASLYICVIKTKLIRYSSSVYFVNQPLHVSGTFVAHHQEVHYIYIYIYIFIQKLVRFVFFGWLYVGRVGQTCPNHVEVDGRNKLRINIASTWFLLHKH